MRIFLKFKQALEELRAFASLRLIFKNTHKLLARFLLVRLHFRPRAASGHHIDPSEYQEDGKPFHPIERVHAPAYRHNASLNVSMPQHIATMQATTGCT